MWGTRKRKGRGEDVGEDKIVIFRIYCTELRVQKYPKFLEIQLNSPKSNS
jgi:hypothetical protein